MNILFVAAEAAPFIKTGGLADVAGSLPKSINLLGSDCRVVLPLYGQIPATFRRQMHMIGHFDVSVGWKREYCGIFELEYEGTIYYFLDNEYYFKRPTIYGQLDDGERFIFFAKAAVRLPRVLDWPIDVLHANDWHAALAPVFLNDYRRGDPFYQDTRSLFTIHNLKYQGQFSPDLFFWTNLDPAYFSDYDLKFYDSMNFMKGAIVHATKVNTVSPTYAEEIHYPFFAEGLQNVINAYSWKLSGILNGIDTEVWDPSSDALLPLNYDADHLSERREIKRALQHLSGLPERDVPLIGMVTRLTAMKGLDLIRPILGELLQEDVQFLVLGSGDTEYEEMFRGFQSAFPHKMAARIHFSNEESHLVYGGADLFLMPSMVEPCGLSQMIAMRYGAVPIVRETGGLRDSVNPYHRETQSGEGFSFANINAHDMLYTIQGACKLYREDPEAFQNLQKRGMAKDLSWAVSSREYLNLYESLNPFAPKHQKER